MSMLCYVPAAVLCVPAADMYSFGIMPDWLGAAAAAMGQTVAADQLRDS